ncbi:MAG: cysteine desulfurase [Methanocellales archaeon]|nr:cysteine desulfurase [Methanocellales archaeon]
MYDVMLLRKDFPVLENVIYLDSAATSQTPRPVVEAMNEYFFKYTANYGRGAYGLARETTERYDEARKRVADFIGAKESQTIFTKNATEAINMVALGTKWSKGDHIVTSILEHHSNLLPWLRLRPKGVEVSVIESDRQGVLNPRTIEEAITERTKLIAITHVSNVFGSIQSIREIAKIAHENGATLLVDGAQSIGHMPVHVKKLDCDFLVFSGHKGLLGPPGTGVLYVKHPEQLEPVYLGGGGIKSVAKNSFELDRSPACFEPGTPNIPGVIGLGAAVEYVEKVGITDIEHHVTSLARDAASRLAELPNIEVYGPLERAGVVSFNVASMNSHDVSMVLDEHGICTRSGHHCAMPAHQFLGISGSVRASFALYNIQEEVDALVSVIEDVTRILT